MPIIYLSPSTQEWNHYVNGGTEEYYMNLIADAMEPYLRSSGIRWTRNTPDMTAASSITQSNRGNYDLHLALHSNAAPESEAGMRQGAEDYYYPTRVSGKRAADIIAENLKAIYPYPWLVKTVPTTRLGEVSRTRAPGVLIEFAYHDNPEDATWIKQHISEIAENVELSPSAGDISTSAKNPLLTRACWRTPTTATRSSSTASGKTGMSSTSTAWSVTPIPAISIYPSEPRFQIFH